MGPGVTGAPPPRAPRGQSLTLTGMSGSFNPPEGSRDRWASQGGRAPGSISWVS